MNFIKTISLALVFILSAHSSQLCAYIDPSIINMQTYALMGLGGATSLVGIASLYSLLKSDSKKTKETPFKKKDYLLVRGIKSTGSVLLGALKIGTASTLAFGGGLLILASPTIIDVLHQ